MMQATKELEDIKHASDKMPPEDRVARTMDLQEDIAAKMKIIKANIDTELNLLPQGKLAMDDDEIEIIHSFLAIHIPSMRAFLTKKYYIDISAEDHIQ